MEISNLLVRSGKTMVYDQMDFFRIPDFLNTHLAKDLDSQGSRAVLGHGHVGRQNSNLARMMDLPSSNSFEPDNLLRKRQLVIVENRLAVTPGRGLIRQLLALNRGKRARTGGLRNG